MAYVWIGGTAVGTVLILAFLPALYAIWFRVSYGDAVRRSYGEESSTPGTQPKGLGRGVPDSEIN